MRKGIIHEKLRIFYMSALFKCLQGNISMIDRHGMLK